MGATTQQRETGSGELVFEVVAVVDLFGVDVDTSGAKANGDCAAASQKRLKHNESKPRVVVQVWKHFYSQTSLFKRRNGRAAERTLEEQIRARTVFNAGSNMEEKSAFGLVPQGDNPLCFRSFFHKISQFKIVDSKKSAVFGKIFNEIREDFASFKAGNGCELMLVYRKECLFSWNKKGEVDIKISAN